MGTLLPLLSSVALAQAVHSGDVCKPASMRDAEIGCWILADDPIGEVSAREVFWHLDSYPTRRAAEADKAPHSVVLASLGKVWLMTIGPAKWNSAHGTRITDIGPLPLPSAGKYSALFMEAIFSPGTTAPPHTHPGPEAWYTTAGETCLETSDGHSQTSRAGVPVIVRSGLVMALTATGSEQRRSIVLILHPTSAAPVVVNHEWTPKGLCGSAPL